jgi:hypothetical protein
MQAVGTSGASPNLTGARLARLTNFGYRVSLTELHHLEKTPIPHRALWVDDLQDFLALT